MVSLDPGSPSRRRSEIWYYVGGFVLLLLVVIAGVMAKQAREDQV
jgi:hypothetical protein